MSPVVRDALRLSASRPSVASGIRAALAATLPLLLIPVLGRPELTWASLAGFNTIMVDKGGAYRSRASAMAGYGAVGAAATGAGTLASTHPVAAIALVLGAVTCFGMLRLFGAAATSVGVSAAVSLVIALALPSADARVALDRAAFSLGGSAWALTFSLLLWPIRPYRPARQDASWTACGSSRPPSSPSARYPRPDGPPARGCSPRGSTTAMPAPYVGRPISSGTSPGRPAASTDQRPAASRNET
jgi:hypothetical protein